MGLDITSGFTASPGVWVGNTTYSLGNQILDDNGNVQQITATTAIKRTGTTNPTWNTAKGGTTADRNVTWTN